MSAATETAEAALHRVFEAHHELVTSLTDALIDGQDVVLVIHTRAEIVPRKNVIAALRAGVGSDDEAAPCPLTVSMNKILEVLCSPPPAGIGYVVELAIDHCTLLQITTGRRPPGTFYQRGSEALS